jgi:hypothetical protein
MDAPPVYLVEQSVEAIAGSRESRRALASKIAGVLESNYARFAYSAPVETFRLWLRPTALRIAIAPQTASDAALAFSAAVPTRPHQHILRRETEPLNANGDATLYAADKRVQQEAGKSRRHMVALYFMHYNFCRVHKTLRVTPAMEAGLTDHVWTLEELVTLLHHKSSEIAAWLTRFLGGHSDRG